MMHSVQRTALRIATSLLVALCAPALNAQVANENAGIAIVTSAAGKTVVTEASGEKRDATLHGTYALQAQGFVTATDAHLFLVCSNGLSIGIDSDTEVYFQTYTQAPFSAKRANLEYEPSTSELVVELKSGAISIASEGLSPRSRIRVITPHGTLRVHSANCRIEHNEASTSIMSFSGNATFYFNDESSREFIPNNTAIRISAQSAKLNEIAEDLDIASLDDSNRDFTNAAEFAANRVFFKAPSDGQTAVPMLIAPSTYFEQPAVRPYEYMD
jgi:hypothetical protein